MVMLTATQHQHEMEKWRREASRRGPPDQGPHVKYNEFHAPAAVTVYDEGTLVAAVGSIQTSVDNFVPIDQVMETERWVKTLFTLYSPDYSEMKTELIHEFFGRDEIKVPMTVMMEQPYTGVIVHESTEHMKLNHTFIALVSITEEQPDPEPQRPEDTPTHRQMREWQNFLVGQVYGDRRGPSMADDPRSAPLESAQLWRYNRDMVLMEEKRRAHEHEMRDKIQAAQLHNHSIYGSISDHQLDATKYMRQATDNAAIAKATAQIEQAHASTMTINKLADAYKGIRHLLDADMTGSSVATSSPGDSDELSVVSKRGS